MYGIEDRLRDWGWGREVENYIREQTAAKKIVTLYREGPSTPIGAPRVVAVARVSSKAQVVRGLALFSQMDHIYEYCREECSYYVVAEIYAMESAYTDDWERRPLLQRVMDVAELLRPDYVFFRSSDRYARSIPVALKLRDELQTLGVPIRTALEIMEREFFDEARGILLRAGVRV